MGELPAIVILSVVIWWIVMWWINQPKAKRKNDDKYYDYDPYEKPKHTEKPIDYSPRPSYHYLIGETYHHDFNAYKSINELEDTIITNPTAPLTTEEFLDMLPDNLDEDSEK